MKNTNEYSKNKAYHQGLKFKNSRLNEEGIYAKLEKQGFPVDLAKEVAKNIVIERKNYHKDDIEDYKNYRILGIVIIVLGVLATIIAYIYTEKIIIAAEMLYIGLATTIIAHLMIKKNIKFN
ncbi:hypothetical protein [Polaribacter sp.]|uniref:hypothetical protein n=1 Tax=Polaribacter sp. TaxID=1920175 RepID=UPI003F6CC327